jgi:thiamine phosphate synthase YjbQ (UPF0047 family)
LSAIKRGLVKSQSGNCDGLVNAMDITASVFINHDESGLYYGYKKWLEELAPHEPVYDTPPVLEGRWLLA